MGMKIRRLRRNGEAGKENEAPGMNMESRCLFAGKNT